MVPRTVRRDLCPARVSQNGCDLLAGQILSDGPIKMIQSDRLGGEQTRRRGTEPAQSETGDCRVEPAESILVARLSMSHLVPLLEFNLSNRRICDRKWIFYEADATGLKQGRAASRTVGLEHECPLTAEPYRPSPAAHFLDTDGTKSIHRPPL